MTAALSTCRFGLAAGALLLLLAAPACGGAPSYGFVADITLSPKAAALLKAKNEGITVAAYYTGEPVPSAMKHADEEGMIDLATENVTIAGSPGRASVTGSQVKPSQVSWVKSVQILINAFSARRSGPNNLLDCTLFEGSVAQAQAKPIGVFCKLIGER